MTEATVADASLLLQELSRPQAEGEGIKSIIERTARAAKLAYWRTFDLWYENARSVKQEEVDQIKAALRAKNERAALNELRDLKFRIARLEAALVSRDADFHSPEIDFAGELLRNARGEDSALAKGRVR